MEYKITSKNALPTLSKNTPLARPLMPFTIDTLFSVIERVKQNERTQYTRTQKEN